MSGKKLRVEGLESRILLAAVDAGDPVPRILGDANSDGVFDSLDLIQVLQAGKYRTGEPADWSQGDWNRDGQFNESDFVVALQASSVDTAFTQEVAARRGTDRPLKGNQSGPVVFVVPDNTCPASGIPGIEELGVRTITDASGNMSHLGRVDSHWEHCAAVPGEGRVYTDGHVTFTAANGDTLEAEYDGDDPALSSFELHVIAGTGRFDGASGTITADFEAVVSDGVPIGVIVDLSGRISY